MSTTSTTHQIIPSDTQQTDTLATQTNLATELSNPVPEKKEVTGSTCCGCCDTKK